MPGQHRQHGDGDRHRGDPGHATTPRLPVAQNKILHIEKDATVPDGTANVTSETISYTLAVTNQAMRRSPMWWWTIRSRPTRRRF